MNASEPSSILGSIGVMGGKLCIAATLATIGVTVETVPAKEGADHRALLESPLEAWDDATRAKMQAAIEQT